MLNVRRSIFTRAVMELCPVAWFKCWRERERESAVGLSPSLYCMLYFLIWSFLFKLIHSDLCSFKKITCFCQSLEIRICHKHKNPSTRKERRAVWKLSVKSNTGLWVPQFQALETGPTSRKTWGARCSKMWNGMTFPAIDVTSSTPKETWGQLEEYVRKAGRPIWSTVINFPTSRTSRLFTKRWPGTCSV